MDFTPYTLNISTACGFLSIFYKDRPALTVNQTDGASCALSNPAREQNFVMDSLVSFAKTANTAAPGTSPGARSLGALIAAGLIMMPPARFLPEPASDFS